MQIPQCSKCSQKPCREGILDPKKLPAFCPVVNFRDRIPGLKEKYQKEKTWSLFINAALTEKECYDPDQIKQGRIFPLRPRIREIAELALKIGAKTLGIAFCSGLSEEALRATNILESHGLKIASAACSCGAVDKAELGIPAAYKIHGPDKFEGACNPLFQAEIFNSVPTDFNVIVGLCIGHDMIFTQHSQAPVTTLIVKDRLLGHNPVIALYSRYHKDLV